MATTDLRLDGIRGFRRAPNRLPTGQREWRLHDRSGREFVVSVRNYYPVPCDAHAELRRYAYLDTANFKDFAGISFSTFWQVWVGLNLLLRFGLPPLASESANAAVPPEVFAARVERTDDYTESGLGGGSPEGLGDACYDMLGHYHASRPSREACQAVISFLTYRSFDGDVRFSEQPFLFYRVGDRLLLWDYLRHFGLLRCLARTITALPYAEAMRARKGEVLEEAVMQAVSTIPRVCGVHKWLYRTQGRAIWDVDVGFVHDGVLFVVDAKNEQKSVRYYFDGVSVAGRVEKRERFLEKIDHNVAQHQSALRDAWRGCEPLRGAIGVVCTEEAEFTASVDPRHWLDFGADIPRTCMLPELMAFLEQDDATAKVMRHPAFTAFLMPTMR